MVKVVHYKIRVLLKLPIYVVIDNQKSVIKTYMNMPGLYTYMGWWFDIEFIWTWDKIMLSYVGPALENITF